MAYLDLTKEGPGWGAQKPGEYAGEITDAVERKSKKGEDMFILTFKDMATGGLLCDDILMLEGRGKGIGIAKLRGLGFDKDFKGDVAAAELIGKRVTVHLNWSEFGGRRELKPDMKQGEYCGYTPLDAAGEDKAPQDVDVDPFSDPPPGEKLDDGNIPF